LASVSQSIYSRADAKRGSGWLTGCEELDSRPEGDVAKLVVLREPIVRKEYLPPYTLEEFARGSVLIFLELNTLFFELPAFAPDRGGRSLPERTEANARVRKPTLKKTLIAWFVTVYANTWPPSFS
jgi:hypothetical protein